MGAKTRRRRSRFGGLRVVMRIIAAALAFGAQGVHLSILPDQVQLWWGYGLFFLIVAMAQGLLGAALIFNDPDRRTVRLGIIANLAIVAVWAVTRTGGIPGLVEFIPLPVIDLDLAATIMELSLIVILPILGWTGRFAARGVRDVTVRPAGST